MSAKPQRQYLVGTLNTRGINANTNFTTYDQLYQNVIFVPIKNEVMGTTMVYVEKRPGFAAGATLTNIAVTTQTFWWAARTSYGGGVVHAGLDVGLNAVVLVGDTVIKTHANGTVVRYITETLNSAGTAFLTWTRPLANEVWGYADGGAAAQITVPSNSVGRMEHMDGWSFIGAKAPARIYNNVTINDPTSAYTSYISCDTEADRLQTVLKYGRYILGMGSTSIEWFVNAGNPTFSPLSRIQDPGLTAKYAKIGLYGTAGTEAGAVCIGGGSVWFISQGADCGIALHRIHGTELTKIASPIVERILTQSAASYQVKYIEWAGIPMVIIVLGTTSAALVYFPQVGLWSYWLASTNTNWNTLVNDVSGIEGSGLRAMNNATIYQWSATTPVYQDNATNITRLIRTATNDYGSSNYKQCQKLVIIGDKATSTQNISTRYSDDDYATYSTAKNIDMSLQKPEIWREGRFVRRAYELSDTNNSAGRIVAIEPWIEELSG